jgi:hypothetical protein
MQVFHLCEPYVSTTSLTVLGKFEQLILVLIRLRPNLSLKDLTYRFKILQTTVSRIWHKWISVLYQRTNFLNGQNEKCCKLEKNFGTKVAVSVGCFEVFIEGPSNLLARAQTWSSYKHHKTLKFLIGTLV